MILWKAGDYMISVSILLAIVAPATVFIKTAFAESRESARGVVSRT